MSALFCLTTAKRDSHTLMCYITHTPNHPNIAMVLLFSVCKTQCGPRWARDLYAKPGHSSYAKNTFMKSNSVSKVAWWAGTRGSQLVCSSLEQLVCGIWPGFPHDIPSGGPQSMSFHFWYPSKQLIWRVVVTLFQYWSELCRRPWRETAGVHSVC